METVKHQKGIIETIQKHRSEKLHAESEKVRMEAAAKEQTGSIPVHTSAPAEKTEKAEKHDEGEKPDPFRTQSIPIIGGGDSKYSELQFGQQNNNK